MHGGIISTSDVFQGHLTVLCSVKNFKCLDAQVCSELIHGTDNHTDELVVVDLTVVVVVKAAEERSEILSLYIYAKVRDCFVEFIRVKCTIAIIVHNFKLAPKADNAATSTSFQFFTESFDEDRLEAWHFLGTRDRDTRGLLCRCSGCGSHRLCRLRAADFLLILAQLCLSRAILTLVHLGSCGGTSRRICCLIIICTCCGQRVSIAHHARSLHLLLRLSVGDLGALRNTG